jgi:hypothetical protein
MIQLRQDISKTETASKNSILQQVLIFPGHNIFIDTIRQKLEPVFVYVKRRNLLRLRLVSFMVPKPGLEPGQAYTH